MLYFFLMSAAALAANRGESSVVVCESRPVQHGVYSADLAQRVRQYIDWSSNVGDAIEKITQVVSSLPFEEQEGFCYDIFDMYRAASYSVGVDWYAAFEADYKKTGYSERFPAEALKQGLSLLPLVVVKPGPWDHGHRDAFLNERGGPRPRGDIGGHLVVRRVQDVYLAQLIDPELSYAKLKELKTCAKAEDKSGV